ncbi:MAG: mandelate racemase/muconate lactonizing enzyme family protein [Chloroflexi bacterium]|nr:MAG: mandelate racemase/muconate lactonizing enzyme family protein [Chloroflexota bacterium]
MQSETIPGWLAGRELTMKITGLTSRIVAYDVSSAWGEGVIPEGITSSIHRYSFDSIETDEGIEGHTMQYGGLGEGAAVGHIVHEAYAQELLGLDPLMPESIWQGLRRKNRHMYNVSDAIIGALDVGIWDIRGKALDVPIAGLLGLARRTVPTYATARTIDPSPDQVYEEAKAIKAAGFRGFKVQFWNGLERDLPRFRAAREAVGPDFTLMQDAGGAYSYLEALEAGRVLEELGYHWFEEPIPDRQVNQLRRLAAELRIPILAAETSHLHELPELLRHGSVDICRGDVLIKSGITGLRKALAACELFGYNLEIHGLGSALLDVANLHVALSVENCEYLESHHPIFELGLKGDPLRIDDNGCRTLPDGPGLGVELDWDWIDDHTVEVIRTPQN